MKNATICEAADFLLANDHYCLITHCFPDGDTIGSAAALCLGLRSLGKKAVVLENPQITQTLAPFVKGLTTAEVDDSHTIVTVDIAAERMFPRNLSAEQLPIALAIDHHEGNSVPTNRCCVRPSAAACAEVVMDVLEAMNVVIDLPIAEKLYLALCTDSGCFRYSSTTEATFRCASKCLQTGLNPYPINQTFFITKRLSRLKLESALTESAAFYHNGAVCMTAITCEMIEKLGVIEEDMENISSFSKEIEGVRIGVMLRELKNGGTKVSMRADPGLSARDICATLGGGGHHAAAGVTLDEDIESVGKAILNAIDCYLQENHAL